MKNRIYRAALTAALAAATALFGLVIPATPALAAKPSLSQTANATTQATTTAPKPQPVYDPAIYLEQGMREPDTRGTEVQKTKYFRFFGYASAGSKVFLQQKSSTGWTTVWTSKPLTYTLWYDLYNVPFSFSSEGSATVRGILVKDGKTVANTAPMTVKYARAATRVVTTGLTLYGDGLFAAARGHVAAGTQQSHTYMMPNTAKDRSGYLQEYKAGRWVTLQTVRFEGTAWYRVTVKTPLTSGTVTRQYRFYVPANSTDKAWTSKPVTIKHTGKA